MSIGATGALIFFVVGVLAIVPFINWVLDADLLKNRPKDRKP